MSRKLLDAVVKSEDIQQVVVIKEEVPIGQQWSSCLIQEDPPELPHIKKEREDLWTNQEREHLQGLEEGDIIKFTFSPFSVKSEDDEEERPQSSQHYRIKTEEISDADYFKTEAGREDCGEPEPAWDLNPESHLQPDTYDGMSHSSENDTDDSGDWEGTRKPQAGLNHLQSNEVPVSGVGCDMRPSPSFSEAASSFGFEGQLQKHDEIQTEEKPFSCPICQKTFQKRRAVVRHLTIHTGEKPFSCSFCGQRFNRDAHLRRHLAVHSGEKPFSCSVCGTTFTRNSTLREHLRIHAGEKPFTCSLCNASFRCRQHLSRHMKIHTGEKQFSCPICGKRFTEVANMRRHITTHTGERPFSCNICDRRFTQLHVLKTHKCVGEGSRSK